MHVSKINLDYVAIIFILEAKIIMTFSGTNSGFVCVLVVSMELQSLGNSSVGLYSQYHLF